jgi:truncated hemoglobin YjbI
MTRCGAGTDITGEKARQVMSIFDRLGPEQGIRAAVDDFYERVVGDPQLARSFEGVDLRTLREEIVPVPAPA